MFLTFIVASRNAAQPEGDLVPLGIMKKCTDSPERCSRHIAVPAGFWWLGSLATLLKLISAVS